MKTFALAATVVAGLLCSASSADAQFRRGGSYRSGSVVTYPSVNTSPYYYNSTPVYNGVVGVGSYTPLGGTTVVVPSGGLAPSYYTPTYSSGSYYTPTYSSGSYYNNSYYNSPYNSGIYISPSGGNIRGRGWRW